MKFHYVDLKTSKKSGEILLSSLFLIVFIGLRQTSAYTYYHGCPLDSTGISSLKILLLTFNIEGFTKNTRYTSVYRVFFMPHRDELAAVNDEERVKTKKETERREARQVRCGEAAKGAKRPPSRRKNKSIGTDIISNSL